MQFQNNFHRFQLYFLTSAGILGFLAIIPGLPTVPFLLLAVTTGVGGFLILKNQDKVKEVSTEENLQQDHDSREEVKTEPENVNKLILIEPIELEIGYGLIPLADEKSGGDLFK